MSKIRRIIESAKSIIIVILASSMLVLWAGYLYIQFDRGNVGIPTLSNDFWLFTNTKSVPGNLVPDKKYYSPKAISLIISGKAYTSQFDGKLTSVLWEAYSPLVTEIFSSAYECSPADVEIWTSALMSPDAILIEFPSQLPYVSISAFLSKKEGFCSGELCNVEKLLLFPSESNTLSGLTKDSDGNIYSFKLIDSDSTSFIYDFNSNNFATYTVNKGFISFDFNIDKNGERIRDAFDGEFKLLHSSPALSPLRLSDPLEEAKAHAFESGDSTYLDLIEDPVLSALLEAFEINPNIAGYYSDSSTGLIFVGENMRLLISPSGAVTYSLPVGSNVPIKTSSILNTAGTSFTSSELITASTFFLNRLPSELLGGDASLTLREMSYAPDSQEFTFKYGYTYNSADILQGSSISGVTLIFNSKGLIRATLTPALFEASEPVEIEDNSYLPADIPHSVALNISGETKSIEPIYSFENYNETSIALWAKEK